MRIFRTRAMGPKPKTPSVRREDATVLEIASGAMLRNTSIVSGIPHRRSSLNRPRAAGDVNRARKRDHNPPSTVRPRRRSGPACAGLGLAKSKHLLFDIVRWGCGGVGGKRIRCGGRLHKLLQRHARPVEIKVEQAECGRGYRCLGRGGRTSSKHLLRQRKKSQCFGRVHNALWFFLLVVGLIRGGKKHLARRRLR